MENHLESKVVTNDIFVRVNVKKAHKYKAPSELSDKVKMVSVELNEVESETEEGFDLNIHIQSRAE
ncbi:MAG: hypothetical protein H7101_11620 [Deinococcales bacterium]|nr:hypothetical protein [Chitinophagaceae bacterium]